MQADQSYIFDPRYDFPRFQGAANAYLICTTPRCGGHYLSHLLWSTGSFGSPSEYFHSSFFDAWKRRYASNCVLGAVQGLVADRTSPNGWFGAKVHWDQFETMRDLAIPESVFAVRGYIVLTREDALAQAISFAIARQTQHWISLDQAPGSAESVYDRELIEACADRIADERRRWMAFSSQIDAPWIEIRYEDLLVDPQTQVEAIARQLQVSGPTRIGDIPITKQGGSRNALWSQLYRDGSL